MNFTPIGSFELESTWLRISDPSYTGSEWCVGILGDCEPGLWDCAVVRDKVSGLEFWGSAVKMLCAQSIPDGTGPRDFSIFNEIPVGNEDSTNAFCRTAALHRETSKWRLCGQEIGVDSAMCGIFDESKIPRYDSNDMEAMWEECVAAAGSDERAGVIQNGVVSKSGFGDGVYRALYRLNPDGRVCAVAVLYI